MVGSGELAATISAHTLACLGDRQPGPVRVAGGQSAASPLKVEFSWPVGGLEADLARELAPLLNQSNKLGDSAAPEDAPLPEVGWRVPTPPAPLLPEQPGVRNLLAVCSAKGGVGKSTLAANLALALNQRGAQVGLLDADIQGPNLPLLLGLDDAKPETRGEGDERRMIPVPAAGLRVLSMAMLASEQSAMIWRGPMVSGALRQFLLRTDWGELDYLVVDMPPGTGDISLTLAQSVPLSGAVLVSTADRMALADTGRGAVMLRKLRVPVLGLVENMSSWQCPGCGERHELFRAASADASADADAGPLTSVPTLASMPLLPPTADGLAQLLADPQGAAAELWRRCADAVAIALASKNAQSTPERPRILQTAE